MNNLVYLDDLTVGGRIIVFPEIKATAKRTIVISGKNANITSE